MGSAGCGQRFSGLAFEPAIAFGIGDRAVGVEHEAGAAAAVVVEHRLGEIGRGGGEIGGRGGEGGERGAFGLGEAELLAFVEDQREIGELGDQQRDADQQRHLTSEAAREEAPHIFRTSAAKV